MFLGRDLLSMLLKLGYRVPGISTGMDADVRIAPEPFSLKLAQHIYWYIPRPVVSRFSQSSLILTILTGKLSITLPSAYPIHEPTFCFLFAPIISNPQRMPMGDSH